MAIHQAIWPFSFMSVFLENGILYKSKAILMIIVTVCLFRWIKFIVTRRRSRNLDCVNRLEMHFGVILVSRQNKTISQFTATPLDGWDICGSLHSMKSSVVRKMVTLFKKMKFWGKAICKQMWKDCDLLEIQLHNENCYFACIRHVFRLTL